MGSATLPKTGMGKEAVLKRLESFQAGDARWHDGRMFGLIYEAGPDVEEVVKAAHNMFLIQNGLNPTAFPSLVKMETEVVSIVAQLTGGDDDTVGSLTSGGTESIFMAMKSARDWAREHHPAVARPEIVVPVTAHPAWNKAAHYLGLDIKMIPVRDDFRADVDAIRAALTDSTVIIGGTAVTYPHGVVDPIVELGELAAERNLWCHVDACLGGLILPFLKKLGYDIPPYGFDIPGVSSVSADIHKYAFTPKGVSTVMYRSRKLRKYQIFAYADWPGGIYATPCLAGARSGGAVAAAWAVFHYLGEKRFLELALKARRATERLIDGINAMDGLSVLSDPEATVFAFTSETRNVYEIPVRMKARGWHMDAQHMPPSLHMTVSPVHIDLVDRFLTDLKQSLAETPPADAAEMSDQAAMYAMLGTMPDRASARALAVDYINDLYTA